MSTRRPHLPVTARAARVIALSLAAAAAASASAAPTPKHTAADCDKPASAIVVRQDFEAKVQKMMAGQQQQQAMLTGEMQRRTDALKWPKERMQALMRDALKDPAFQAMEREKAPYVKDMMAMMQESAQQTGPQDTKTTCLAVLRAEVAMDAATPINDREYAFLLQKVKAAR